MEMITGLQITILLLVSAVVGYMIFIKQRAREVVKRPVDPVDEARVYIRYGQRKDAVRVLQHHLQRNPADEQARVLLSNIGG